GGGDGGVVGRAAEVQAIVVVGRAGVGEGVVGLIVHGIGSPPGGRAAAVIGHSVGAVIQDGSVGVAGDVNGDISHAGLAVLDVDRFGDRVGFRAVDFDCEAVVALVLFGAGHFGRARGRARLLIGIGALGGATQRAIGDVV